MLPTMLTFGYLYDFRNPPQWYRRPAELYAETLDIIAGTEALGFAGAWLPEHHLADDGYMPSPLVTLAAVAARTTSMRIGTAVALAPLHHPVRFAQDCALLDTLSDGRLDIGLAIGYRRRETAAFGIDFTRRGALFDEFLQIIGRLWAGETVDFDGTYFQIAGAKLMPPAPRGHIPLYIGGFAGKAVQRVATYGDGYLGTAEVCGLYVDKLRELGRDPAAARLRITALTTVVARDPEQAMAELAPHYLHINNSYGQWNNEDNALGMAGMRPMSLEQYKASGELQILTPEQAIAMLTDLDQRTPLEHYIMLAPPGLPADRFMAYAEVFATDVLPAFAR
ncbi:LLM class flavin-dependent oxidoreductase [Mycobacterium sp.]|uniref:LLM class flavin-dependent oxidoreductase n=1 Tax=Mycobacterium sp. TaxID=1785 RepID=UPI003F999C23